MNAAVAMRAEGPIEQLPATHPAQTAISSPMDLISRALASGASIEMVKELVALNRELAAEQARKAFDQAMSAAQATIPPITKNKRVGFDSKKQGAARTDYRHETLDEIDRVVKPILAQHGLSYRFRVSSEIGQPIRVVCVVAHRDGHFEETPLTAGRDDSGNKNSIQAIGSTITYLQRYTLKAALGLAAAEDDDGKASGPASLAISDDQVAQLRQLIVSTGSSLKGFLELWEIDRVEDLQAANFPPALRLLEQKAARQSQEVAR